MSVKPEKRISRRKLKRIFTFIGLLLLIYAFSTMFLPYTFNLYMEETNSPILHDDLLYYGIYFIIIVFGTLIPFFIMRKYSGISLKRINRNISATFSDLFVQTIVFFTVCIFLTYVSSMLFVRIGIDGKLLSGIGFSFDTANLNNHLYIFMLLVVSPILEEYAFRGVLLNSLGKYGKVFGLYASSIIFAIAHTDFSEMIPAFMMGVILGKTSLRYKSIKPTIVIHILFNVMIYALCVIPNSIAKYVAYGLVAICVVAFALVITGKYQRIQIQKLRSNKTTNKLFYTRPTIIISLALMIIYTILISFYL